jgi:DNA polymerase I
LEEEGAEVIYSDTDSVFVRSPKEELEGTKEFGKALAKRFSHGARILEFEKVFRSFFTHGKKKRYVGMIAWPTEEMVVRGYEMRRTDSFDLQSSTLQTVFEMVLSNDTDGALELARKVIGQIKKGEVDVSSLVISRSVQEVEEEKIAQRYKNPDSMANIQALRKARRLGLELVPGMKVSWVVTDAKAKPQRVEPYIDGREFEFRPDLNYYAERLSSTLARVTEVFGISEKELLTGVQQTSLFDAFSGETDDEDKGSEKKEPKEKEEKERPSSTSTATLDQWM